MTTQNESLKVKLEEELKKLEAELKTVGTKNPQNEKDWQPKPADVLPDAADESELADSLEEFENNAAILKQLEIRYNEVKEALQRIEKNEYGKCKICAAEIELPRLEANPAAETCMQHLNPLKP